jgi:chorismate synthase
MASNSFGNIFRITTWGESHGPAIGVVIDGCPAGFRIDTQQLQQDVCNRSPGNNTLTSKRKEPDKVEILSGIFNGETTGAPISILIWNKDQDSSKYEPIKDLYRPGHANFTYLEKYKIFDYRGGGRSSGRETACRVAAGAIAKQILAAQGIKLKAYIRSIGSITASGNWDINHLLENTQQSAVLCPDEIATKQITQQIIDARSAGDSLGGVVECCASFMPTGLGDPIYEKLEAKLASAMLSIPASKGFEIGSGFNATTSSGYENNDTFTLKDNKVNLTSNNSGGVLGGISTGEDLIFKVAFKPTSSIFKQQDTVDTKGNKTTLNLPTGSRHDPCIAIRAVFVVEAMTALVLLDSYLANKLVTLK